MPVGRFHDVEIARIALLHVRERLQPFRAAGEECAVRAAGEHPVDNADNLGARDRAVRLICTLAVVQIAACHHGGNVPIAPEAHRHIRKLYAAFLEREEPGRHRAEFRR